VLIFNINLSAYSSILLVFFNFLCFSKTNESWGIDLQSLNWQYLIGQCSVVCITFDQ